MTTLDLGATTIAANEMTVAVVADYGVRAWLASWSHQPTSFEDGREFVPQERSLVNDPQEPSDAEARKRPTRSGTIHWTITSDGLYEFGNAPTLDGKLTRGFLRIQGGTVTRLPYAKKTDLIATLPAASGGRRRGADAF